MEFTPYLAQFLAALPRPTNRATALQQLDSLTPYMGLLPTKNSLRELFGLPYEAEFWLRVGLSLRQLTVNDLIPVRVNPQAIQAAQPFVGAAHVEALLTLPPPVFGRLITGAADPLQPVVVLKTPHGLVSVNGHHRIYVLQLLGVRVARLCVVPVTPALYIQIVGLYREFGYVDMRKGLSYTKDR